MSFSSPFFVIVGFLAAVTASKCFSRSPRHCRVPVSSILTSTVSKPLNTLSFAHLMTKIQKKYLRRRQPQLPINYPGPDVIPFDFEKERARIENICRRLADNEVEVREQVMKEVPRLMRDMVAGWSPEAIVAALSEWYSAFTTTSADETAVTSASSTSAPDGNRKRLRPGEHFAKPSPLVTSTQVYGPQFDGQQNAVAKESLQLDKLCFGLFFCIWHSDKPLPQLSCVQAVADLILVPTTHAARLMVVRSMIRIMGKMWGTIDQYRLDKYMAFVRRVAFKCIEECVDSPDVFFPWFEAMYKKEVVLAAAIGLNMHLCDVFLQELVRSSKVSSATFFCDFVQRIPFHAMSRGDGCEKRVVDNLVVPIAGGVLEEPKGELFSKQAAELLAERARDRSVDRGTLYAIRPLFAEIERVLKTYGERLSDPAAFQPISLKERNAVIAKDVARAGDAQATIVARVLKARKAKKMSSPGGAGKKRSIKSGKSSGGAGGRSRHASRRK